MREKMTGMVLATDMTSHFEEIGKLKTRVRSDDFDPEKGDKQIIMNQIVHLSDINNATKGF